MPFFERMQTGAGMKHWHTSIDATYHYTAGTAGKRFLETLRDEGKILAVRCPTCDVQVLPPRAFCETCFADLADAWEDAGVEGTLEAVTVLRMGLDGKPLPEPELRGLVRFPGGGAMLHRVLAAPGGAAVGDRVRARLLPKKQRQARITDILGFEPVG